MTRRLYLMRHAEAEPAGRDALDQNRALTASGREDAARVGRWLRAHEIAPARMLVSPAQRCRQSFEALHLPDAEAAIWAEDLYLASCETLLRLIGGTPDNAPSVFVLAHNPGLHDLVSHHATGDRALCQHGFPTAALIVLELADSWRQVETSPLLIQKL